MIYKIIFLGPTNAGKTSLFLKSQSTTTSTIGCAFHQRHEKISNRIHKFNIWDTAGQEQYHSLLPLYTRHAHAAALCFDLSEKTINLNHYKTLVQEIPNIILVGCKADLVSNPDEILASVARKYGICDTLATSAHFNPESVDTLFSKLFTMSVTNDNLIPSETFCFTDNVDEVKTCGTCCN